VNAFNEPYGKVPELHGLARFHRYQFTIRHTGTPANIHGTLRADERRIGLDSKVWGVWDMVKMAVAYDDRSDIFPAEFFGPFSYQGAVGFQS